MQDFYDRLVEQTVPVPGLREAELAKLLENTFRHVNIALVNELAVYCHDLGLDVWSVVTRGTPGNHRPSQSPRNLRIWELISA